MSKAIEIAEKIWGLLTYPVSTELNDVGYAPRPISQGTVDYLKDLLDELKSEYPDPTVYIVNDPGDELPDCRGDSDD